MRFSPRRGSRSAPADLAGFGVILFVLGAVFVFVSNVDYSDYTGRADAVVVERVVTTEPGSDGGTRTDTDVYVSYTTRDGTRFEHVSLGGLNVSRHHEGERVEVAYRPGVPSDPVTARSTEPGAFNVFWYLGIGMAVLAVGLVGRAVLLLLRGRS